MDDEMQQNYIHSKKITGSLTEDVFIDLREKRRRGGREREAGIKLTTLWCMRGHSNQPSHQEGTAPLFKMITVDLPRESKHRPTA